MAGEIAGGTPLPAALRRFHDVSNGRLEIMALMYDLDGALEAGQAGLARYTATSLLDASVALWLRERGIAVPAFEHATSRARVALALLAAVNTDLAGRVSAIYRNELPPEAEPVSAYCQTVLDLAGELTGYGGRGLTASVSGWADSARSMRAMCDGLGVPLHNFYWPPPDAQTWYGDVMRFASREAARAAHDSSAADDRA